MNNIKYITNENGTMKLYCSVCLALMVLLLSSCNKLSPSESITKIIEATEDKLYYTNSIDELVQLQDSMLNEFKTCLKNEHGGYLYQEGDEEFNQIIKRLDRYNIIYCRSLSRYNPELHTENGDRGKVVQVLALMRTMEVRALTKPNGFSPNSDERVYNDRTNSILPTPSEIEEVNKKLPVLAAEGLMLTRVEYDEKSKTQTFQYAYTRDIENIPITQELLESKKQDMINALQGSQNEDRLRAGMTIVYEYKNMEKEALYEIRINANDLK